MPTQEQINAANLELQIASDNYNRAQNKIDQYNRIFNSYMNMSDEKKRDPRIVSAMQNAIADYNNLKLERTTNMERMNNAQVALNEYNAQAVAQQQAATQRGGERRRVIVPETIVPEPETVVSETGGTPIYNDKGEVVGRQLPAQNMNSPVTISTQDNTVRYVSNFVPNQAMIDVQTGKPGTLTSGGSNNPTVGEYLGNVWNGITTTYMNPNEIVYQSNSRLPGFNLGANIGRVGTVGTVLAGGYGYAAPQNTMGLTSAGTTKVVNPSSLNLGKYKGAVQQTWNYGKAGTPSAGSIGNPALMNSVNRTVSNNLAKTVSNSTLSNRLPNGTAVKSLANAKMTPQNVNSFWTVANKNPNASIANTVYKLSTK